MPCGIRCVAIAVHLGTHCLRRHPRYTTICTTPRGFTASPLGEKYFIFENNSY